jgi:hypothetical protein
LPLRTVQSVINSLPSPEVKQLPTPEYLADSTRTGGIMLAAREMEYHMTSEGWQLQLGFQHVRYPLYGHNFSHFYDTVDVSQIDAWAKPQVVVIQDKREWHRMRGNHNDTSCAFRNLDHLKSQSDIFKVGVLKDAHHDAQFQIDAANESGIHAWMCYYHPRIVKHLAPYVRPEHLIRIYHSVNQDEVPEYTPDDRKPCVISGAASNWYPLRVRIINNLRTLPHVEYRQHPGYHLRGSSTPEFLQYLSGFKVAICTSSKLGYALRKIIEATACGCAVITDLPLDDQLPKIDCNLIRVSPDISMTDLKQVIHKAVNNYDPQIQKLFADAACEYYDYRASGLRMMQSIENLRRGY